MDDMTAMSPGVVGFILKGYPRLSETFITNEILLLERLGCRLHIFAMRDPGDAAVYERAQHVQAPVTYIPDYFWPFAGTFVWVNVLLWWSRPALYWQAFCFAIVHSVRGWNSATLKRFVQAAYLVQKECPGTDVAHWHAHFSHDPTTVAFFASWLTGIRYSFSAHAKDIYVQDQEFLRRKIAHACFVVTCTAYNQGCLEQLAATATPILRCYHGVDIDFFTMPRRPQLRVHPRILSIGRLVAKKGFFVLLDALRHVRQSGVKFQCTIIGEGPLHKALTQRIAASGLDDCVELVGAMSQRELLQHYQAADVFSLACEIGEDGDRDGIPNVIVEAMAMGLPIIATDISGIPECVEHGVTGILVPQKDPGALANGILTLLRHPDTAQLYGRAGRAKVERMFDASHNVEQICTALRRATEN